MTFLILAAAFAQPAAPATNAHADHAGHANHAPAAAPATPRTAQRYSINSTLIGDLMANQATKAVIDRHLPGFSAHPMIGQASGLTLKAVQGFAQGAITDEMLAAIERDLAALPAS